MADSNDVLALQTAINRFSTVAGFPAVRPDGVVTGDVLAAALRALGWIASGGSITDENDFTVDTTEPQQDRAQALIVVTDQAALRNDPSNVTDFLNGVADSLGLTTAHSGTPGVKQSAAAAIVDTFPAAVQAPLVRFAPRVPLWVKLAGIAGALGFVGWLFVRRRGSRQVEL